MFSIQGVESPAPFSYVPDFVAKTQNPVVHDLRYEEFTIPSLDDFVGGDRDELLLFLIMALKNISVLNGAVLSRCVQLVHRNV